MRAVVKWERATALLEASESPTTDKVEGAGKSDFLAPEEIPGIDTCARLDDFPLPIHV